MASQLSAAVPRFHGLRGYAAPRSAVAALPSVRVGRKRSSSQGIRCDYIGSATNLVGIYICIHVKSDEYVREEKTDDDH